MIPIIDTILEVAGNVLGSKDKDGQSQLLELFKGQEQKQREFRLELQKAVDEKFKLQLQDRENAREMQIAALKQKDPLSKRYIYYLTSFIILVAAILSIVPIFMEIPEKSLPMLTRATDFFYMVAGGSVIGFFYGSDSKK